ncbi:Hypothetical Protein FCC1311_038772 [Hondaea fermentalgiana]|uniref:Uncharacterized protein n=1 Tax=Hondaea fermentalgiana TaxID=2315210 RepID=A0A2R5GIF4_9STRA|nr:Hypothetical Protein FCC1311_038772 [Hondaea fermentalgiana]|eukprot:GBG27654.1 Hypothetical Protein FCC1311_038772 [Hondaea fermentalgiana]
MVLDNMSKGDKMRVYQMVGTIVSGLTCVGAVAYSIVFLTSSDPQLSLSRESAPEGAVYLVLAPVILQILVSILGFLSALRKEREWILAFFGVQIATLVFTMAAFIFVLLMGNGTLSGGTRKLTDAQAGRITLFALTNPETWIEFQDEKIDGSTCCGLEVRSAYNSDEGGYAGLPDFELEDIFSGDACVGSGIEQVIAFKAEWPTFNATVEEAAESELPFQRDRFICFDRAVTAVRRPAFAGGVSVGICVLSSTGALACAAMLLYSIKQVHGGLKPEALYPEDDGLLPSMGNYSCCPVLAEQLDARANDAAALPEHECFVRVSGIVKSLQGKLAVLDGEVELLWQIHALEKKDDMELNEVGRIQRCFGADTVLKREHAYEFDVPHTSAESREQWPCGDGDEVFRNAKDECTTGIKSLAFYPSLACIHLTIYFDGLCLEQDGLATGATPLNRRCLRLELVRNPLFPHMRFVANAAVVTRNKLRPLLPRVAASLVSSPSFLLTPELARSWQMGPKPTAVQGVDFSGLFSTDALVLIVFQMRAQLELASIEPSRNKVAPQNT